MTLYEAIGVAAAILTALAAYTPIIMGIARRVKDIATWRQSVDDKLKGLADARKAGDDELGRSLDGVRDQLVRFDDRQHDMANAVRDLAGVAGRALGRTEGNE